MNDNQINREKINEAFRQADANISFEDIKIENEKVKTKELKYGNRPLGRLSNRKFNSPKK